MTPWRSEKNLILDLFGIAFGQCRTGNWRLVRSWAIILMDFDILIENFERFANFFLQSLVIVNSSMVSDADVM